MNRPAAFQIIEQVFGDKPTEWHALKKGMTNQSFVFSVNDAKYVFRIPGEGTDCLINRHQEAQAYATISGYGFCDDPIYFDARSGYKITRYLEGVRPCDASDVRDVTRCMQLLKRLHDYNLEIDYTFNLYEHINYYEMLRGDRLSLYHDYNLTKDRVRSLAAYVDTLDRRYCLAHIDAVPDNFLFYCLHGDEGLQLTDWEYASMQDPHVDIAMFCLYCVYDRQDVDRTIDIYFDGLCPISVRAKIYCYIAICGLLWSNWCEYKQSLGIELGSYAQRQYCYARKYSCIAKQAIEEL